MNAVVKPKRCRICRKEYIPARPLQACCSAPCAIQYAKFAGEKRLSIAQKRLQTAEKREALDKLKTLSKFVAEAQREFNRFIRERDYALGCISCDAPQNYSGQWNAGHYRTTAAAAHLRFNEDNVAKQCGQCNHHKSGNVAAFRVGLVGRIGEELVLALENNNRTHKWTRDELVALRKEYARKWRALRKARDS